MVRKKKHSAGRYYGEDSEDRHQYFEEAFFKLAFDAGVDFFEITSFEDFDVALRKAYGRDPSLLEYYNNMSETEKEMFYSRQTIQDMVIINKKLFGVPVKKIKAPEKPRPIARKKKWVKTYKKGIRTRGYRSYITRRGKKTLVHRDIRGRFVSLK